MKTNNLKIKRYNQLLQKSAFEKHKFASKALNFKENVLCICIFFQNSKCQKKNKIVKTMVHINVKLFSRNYFESVGDCDLELM